MLTNLQSNDLVNGALVSTPFFARTLESHGAQIAIVSRSGALSYTELAQAADTFAQRLNANVRLVLIEGRNETAALVALPPFAPAGSS